MKDLIIHFNELRIGDVGKVGGKNASLGEMVQQLQPLGIQIPNGFAVTADAFRFFLEENKLTPFISESLSELDKDQFSNLRQVSQKIKECLLGANIPEVLISEIVKAYRLLCEEAGREVAFCVG